MPCIQYVRMYVRTCVLITSLLMQLGARAPMSVAVFVYTCVDSRCTGTISIQHVHKAEIQLNSTRATKLSMRITMHNQPSTPTQSNQLNTRVGNRKHYTLPPLSQTVHNSQIEVTHDHIAGLVSPSVHCV